MSAVNSADNSVQTLSVTYVDRALNLKGTQTCSANNVSLVNDIDVKMTKGWNAIAISSQVNVTAGNSTLKTTIRNGGIGASSKWYLTGNTTTPTPAQDLGSFKLPISIFR